jgi:hypothetical protein
MRMTTFHLSKTGPNRTSRSGQSPQISIHKYFNFFPSPFFLVISSNKSYWS